MQSKSGKALAAQPSLYPLGSSETKAKDKHVERGEIITACPPTAKDRLPKPPPRKLPPVIGAVNRRC